MKKRSDYRIIKFQYDARPDYFKYTVQQKFLWFFWVKPDMDNILSHYVPWCNEGNKRAKDFSTLEYAEEAINEALEYQNSRVSDEIVG